MQNHFTWPAPPQTNTLKTHPTVLRGLRSTYSATGLQLSNQVVFSLHLIALFLFKMCRFIKSQRAQDFLGWGHSSLPPELREFGLRKEDSERFPTKSKKTEHCTFQRERCNSVSRRLNHRARKAIASKYCARHQRLLCRLAQGGSVSPKGQNGRPVSPSSFAKETAMMRQQTMLPSRELLFLHTVWGRGAVLMPA